MRAVSAVVASPSTTLKRAIPLQMPQIYFKPNDEKKKMVCHGKVEVVSQTDSSNGSHKRHEFS